MSWACVAVGGALLFAAWWMDAEWWERHAKPYRCIREPHTLPVGNFVRFCAVVAALVTVFVLRPVLAAQAKRGRLAAGSFLRSGVAVLLALLATEGILRWKTPPSPPPPPTVAVPLPPPPPFSPPVVWSACCRWRLQPSHEHPWHAGGRDFAYRVNAHGHRARSVDAAEDRSRPTILVVGESLALGMGNPWEETFAGLLEARTGLQVVNLAQPGYAVDQAYLLLEEELPRFEKPVAIVSLLLADQVWRAEHEHNPRVRLVDGKLTRVEPEPQWKRDLRLRRLFRDAFHASDVVDDVRALVRATLDLGRTRGAEVLFVFTNAAEACVDVEGRAPWLYRTLLEEPALPAVRVDIPPELRLTDGDVHPGPAAHRVLADAIEGALRARHALP